MKHEEALWCIACQRGMSGEPTKASLKSCDDCPICKRKQSQIAPHMRKEVAKLMTVKEAHERHSDKVAAQKKLRELNTVRGQETIDEKLYKQQKVYEGKMADQQAQIEALMQTVGKLTESAPNKATTSSSKK